MACLAFGIALTNSQNLIVKQIETSIELGHVKAQAMRELAAEKRMNTQAIDEMRLEMQQTLKNAGVNAPNTHEHGK